ncbi:MAG: dTDP-glucose 4,6-dehydratase [Clostridia bacterium]
MKNIIVTGGAGFIGSNFIKYMLKKYNDIKIINYDKLTYAGNLNNLNDIENNPNYFFIKGDILDRKLIDETLIKYNIDTVLNFAAESHVDRSINDASDFIETNVKGTLVLIEACKKYWSNKDSNGYKKGVKYLQVSTDEVYGSLGEDGYFSENTPIDPHSPYSASKASADLLVKSFVDTHKFPAVITRCSNNYGPYQFPEKLIPLIINKCIKKEKLPIYGDGLNIRDWLYVEDHCSAIDKVLTNGRIGQVYNVGGHNEKSNIYIVKKIIDILSKKVDDTISEDLISFVEDRKGHDRRYGIDPKKIINELDWKPETKFDDGIEKTIDWYINNKKWMDNIITGEYKNKGE